MNDIVTLDYGSGGKKTSELIDEIILPAFGGVELSKLNDGAILAGSEKIVFSTDSFVVNPCFFPGGDIGKLAVCGTVNDIAMCGGVPKYISLGLIIEEGFKTEDLRTIVNSISDTAREAGVQIVTGDTKVVERGKGDGIYINTSGIGFLKYSGLGRDKIEDGDAVIVTGTVGDHGMAVMSARNNMNIEGNLLSDCAPLNKLAESILKYGEKVKILRDPTRGGIATTLNEFVEGSSLSIELLEDSIPLRESVVNLCDILGLDPLYSANEGKILAVVSKDAANDILKDIRKLPYGSDAAIIGRVTSEYGGRVFVRTSIGGRRVLAKLSGAQLPRIC